MPDRTITRELERVYGLDRDVPCPRCGYNLRGNVGGRCPECGADVEGYLKKLSVGGGRRRVVFVQDVRERLLAYLGPTLAVGLAAGVWLTVRATGAPGLIERITGAAMAVMVLLAADVWWQLVRRLWRRRSPAERALRVLACWSPALAGLAAILVLAV